MSHDDGGKPLAWVAYEALAALCAARVDTKPHNAYAEFQRRDPKDYAELSRQLGLLCVQAVTRAP